MTKKPKSQKSDKSDIPKNKAIVFIVVVLAVAWYAYNNPVTTGIVALIGLIVAFMAVAALILWQLKGTVLGTLLKLK